MIFRILGVVVLLLTSIKSLQAQNRQFAHPVITPQEADSLRVEVINKELHLTREESKNFWPVYDEYLHKLEDIQRNTGKENAADRKNVDQLNDRDLNRFINRDFEVQQQKLDMKKQYDAIFRRILPLKKLAHFYIAQNQFSRQLIRYRISKGVASARNYK